MIYCQRCKKPNPEDVDYCESCGARLMIVTHSFEKEIFEQQEGAFEEHLLERISALEAALARSNDRFEQLLDLAHQQATGSFYDHMMLESLTELLTEMHAVDGDELESRWRTRVARHHEETAERERLDERCDLIINAFRGTARDTREQFIDLVEEGTLLISEGRARRGLRMLVTALALDEQNTPLCFTIGEYFFHQGKGAEAAQYLQRALAKESAQFGAELMLGLIDGQDGRAETAKAHLQCALTLNETSFAAHYGLGRLLLTEKKFKDALDHLKLALALKPTAEMYYLVGRIYWEQKETTAALKHLRKAVRLDPAFDPALYSLGFIYWQTERQADARELLLAAYELNPFEKQYQLAAEAESDAVLPAPPPLSWSNIFPASGQPKTAGQRRQTHPSEARFAELLRDDLQTISLIPRKAPRK